MSKLISFLWYDNDDIQHSELQEEQDYADIDNVPGVQLDTALGLGGRVVSSGVPEVSDRDQVSHIQNPSH